MSSIEPKATEVRAALWLIVVMSLVSCGEQQDWSAELANATASEIRAAASDDATHIIHKPAAGCPHGWRLSAEFFRETDGSTEDACVRLGGSLVGSDYLLPGESATLDLLIEQPTTTNSEVL
jgi:hypothetical protein